MTPFRSVQSRFCALAAVLLAASACEPEVVAGSWPCATDDDLTGTPAEGDVPGADAPIVAPWTTGFENGFCDYGRASGFCYADVDSADHQIVRSPVRSGSFAAAFIQTSSEGSSQTRCVRQGILPAAAYYGAWYYIPAFASNAGNWNLFFFQGGMPGEALHGLWGVSLRSTPEGELFLYVFDHLRPPRSLTGTVPVPIGEWFHVEFYLKRAADTTGEIALYQDGELVTSETDLVTDDTVWAQWYVGNLADALTPAESTVYVDDVTIRTTR